ncbi:copper ion binding protein [Salinibacterium sp. SYSU T00001]|uniref:heavy-metal-associated domain-containing protein n=1 Tax=Homoserinimonas sedimenticola TaxID=2986805 RepID=UPI002235F605|nr:copper ion binding protein [Salinibacterium sedimenticola]MCW4385923.1 copper ion binding protein [Salinibacterium sedimenticola]
METTYSVKGMTCEHCVRAVTEEVSKVAGVTDVKVDLAAETVVVESESKPDAEAIAAAIDEAGYELSDSPAAP